MRALVSDERWLRKITYHRALVLSGIGQETQAKEEFAKLGAIDPETESDVEILQAYLDLCGDGLSFAETNAICDRILALSQSISDVVQYHGVKAMTYSGIGDCDEARKQMALAVAHAHIKEREGVLDARTRLLVASGLSFLGLLTREDRHFVEAEQKFKDLQSDQEQWSVEGRAMLWTNLGECYRYWGKWTEGAHAYREAVSLHPTGIRSVFLAECEIHKGRKDEAACILDAVDFAALAADEQVDFAYVMAELAVESADRRRLKAALAILEGVKPTAPYFDQRRLSFIVQVQAALATGGTWQALKKFFSEPLHQLNRYVMLRPNFMGIGIDINAMIADSLKTKDNDDV